MDPSTRRLIQVRIPDDMTKEQLEQDVFECLMGSSVPPRRRFIEDQAGYANIDA